MTESVDKPRNQIKHSFNKKSLSWPLYSGLFIP